MLSLDKRIWLKRLKRKRELQKRLKAYGSVFNHRTMFGDKKPEFVLPTPTIGVKRSWFKRFINWVKSFFV